MNDVCVYCSPRKPAQAPPSDEHVIPRAFGTFRNNLVLNRGVCSDCNQFFGDKLELVFARGSWESILRLNYRLRPLDRIDDLRKDRIRCLLVTSDEYDGLVLEYRNVGNRMVVTLVPQVRFHHHRGSGWSYLVACELADLSRPVPDEVDITKPDLLISEEGDEEALTQLRRALSARGIGYSGITDITRIPVESGQSVKAIVEALVDGISLRCAAKVAFNYLTKVAGISLAAQKDFDLIRAYIRFGTHPGYHAVEPTWLPILRYDSVTRRQTHGHIVTAGWSPSKRNIVAQVSFFNSITYRVMLARNFSGVWRQIRSGHHFDIEARNAEPLGVYPRRLWPT